MLHFHDFRPHVKKRWISSHLRFPQETKNWREIQNTSAEVYEPFQGGKELVDKNTI